LHVLIDAVRRLRQVYADVKVNVAGGGFGPASYGDYARFVSGLVRDWRLQDTVTFLGWTDAEGLVQQLRQAHCFVTPSFVENGCNALQEAMLVGTPSLATFSGGMTTTIDSERTGLAFPAGDPALLAWEIHRLFQDDDLAVRLSAAARAAAREKHSPERIEGQLMRAYEEVRAIGTRSSSLAPSDWGR
jgi:glycosyltransferase involved in cell wall biosynthesis